MILNHFKCLHIDVECVVSVALPSHSLWIARSFVHHNVSPVHKQRNVLRTQTKNTFTIWMNTSNSLLSQWMIQHISGGNVDSFDSYTCTRTNLSVAFRLFFSSFLLRFCLILIWWWDDDDNNYIDAMSYMVLTVTTDTIIIIILLLREADDNIKCYRRTNRMWWDRARGRWRERHISKIFCVDKSKL